MAAPRVRVHLLHGDTIAKTTATYDTTHPANMFALVANIEWTAGCPRLAEAKVNEGYQHIRLLYRRMHSEDERITLAEDGPPQSSYTPDPLRPQGSLRWTIRRQFRVTFRVWSVLRDFYTTLNSMDLPHLTWRTEFGRDWTLRQQQQLEELYMLKVTHDVYNLVENLCRNRGYSMTRSIEPQPTWYFDAGQGVPITPGKRNLFLALSCYDTLSRTRITFADHEPTGRIFREILAMVRPPVITINGPPPEDASGVVFRCSVKAIFFYDVRKPPG